MNTITKTIKKLFISPTLQFVFLRAVIVVILFTLTSLLATEYYCSNPSQYSSGGCSSDFISNVPETLLLYLSICTILFLPFDLIASLNRSKNDVLGKKIAFSFFYYAAVLFGMFIAYKAAEPTGMNFSVLAFVYFPVWLIAGIFVVYAIGGKSGQVVSPRQSVQLPENESTINVEASNVAEPITRKPKSKSIIAKVIFMIQMIGLSLWTFVPAHMFGPLMGRRFSFWIALFTTTMAVPSIFTLSIYLRKYKPSGRKRTFYIAALLISITVLLYGGLKTVQNYFLLQETTRIVECHSRQQFDSNYSCSSMR